MAKILVADDDRKLNKVVRDWLANVDHHTVDQAFDGEETKEFLESYQYELVVLDWDMPKYSGVQVCAEMRKRGLLTPVLMLTGKDTVNDKTTGLDAGADDYLTKPFDAEELSARVRALLRRRTETSSKLLVEDLELDLNSRLVKVRGTELKLQPAEYLVLQFLCRNVGKRFTMEAIVARCAPSEAEAPSESGARSSISRLRSKLKEAGSVATILKVDDEFFVANQE